MSTDKPNLLQEDLERSLERAAQEPAYRPAFYRDLLAAIVFVVGDAASSSEPGMLEPGSNLHIVGEVDANGARFIPFFSSLDKLLGFIHSERNYIALPSKSLFEITRGERLVLNPGASWGKEFLPAEIEALLSSGTSVLPERRTIERAKNVMLGQPADYPAAMVASLSKCFVENESVVAGYLALMHDPSLDQHPHLLVGIEADGDFEAVARDAGVVISATTPHGEPVDIVQVRAGEGGVSEYMLKSTVPFFHRRNQRH
jgi:hypothetical protein